MRRQTAAVTITVCALLMLSAIGYSQPTVTRPIADFVDAQGTFCFPDGMGGCFLFVPPVPNFIGLSASGPPLRCASVDYAGVANRWLASQGASSLGTLTSGTIVERPLPDGRAEVTVLLSTKKALAWVVDGCDDSLYSSTGAGAPLPDFEQLVYFPIPGQELRFVGLRAQADGQLRAAFGVPDGSPGRATVIETGVFMASFKGATADGFPSEQIDLKPVGK